jgi:hypothetical protein
MTPAIVATIQKLKTVRLWARTQRVSEDKTYLRFEFRYAVAARCFLAALPSIGK